MKTKKEIEEMYNFIGWFNEGKFMNQEYRDGIMVALSFVLYNGGTLDTLKHSLKDYLKQNEEE